MLRVIKRYMGTGHHVIVQAGDILPSDRNLQYGIPHRH
jgi:hypothetical protein